MREIGGSSNGTAACLRITVAMVSCSFCIDIITSGGFIRSREQNAEIDAGGPLDEQQTLQVLETAAKKARQARDEYSAAGRPDPKEIKDKSQWTAAQGYRTKTSRREKRTRRAPRKRRRSPKERTKTNQARKAKNEKR